MATSLGERPASADTLSPKSHKTGECGACSPRTSLPALWETRKTASNKLHRLHTAADGIQLRSHETSSFILRFQHGTIWSPLWVNRIEYSLCGIFLPSFPGFIFSLSMLWLPFVKQRWRQFSSLCLLVESSKANHDPLYLYAATVPVWTAVISLLHSNTPKYNICAQSPLM